MAATWDIQQLKVTKTVGSLSDVVTNVNFYVYDSETEGSGESAKIYNGYDYGTVELADADASSFTDYSSITKDNAVAWVKSALGSDAVTAYETSVATQISDKKNNPTFTGVPW
jgi:hypothetical protein